MNIKWLFHIITTELTIKLEESSRDSNGCSCTNILNCLLTSSFSPSLDNIQYYSQSLNDGYLVTWNAVILSVNIDQFDWLYFIIWRLLNFIYDCCDVGTLYCGQSFNIAKFTILTPVLFLDYVNSLFPVVIRKYSLFASLFNFS